MSATQPVTQPATQRPRVSILVPVFNEEGSLRLLVEAVRETLFSSERYDFSLLFIDDGSSDGSWRRIREIAAGDARFRGIRLSRNFGSHVAITAGFQETDGDAVAILACDLQDPPEVILEFLARWEAGAEIVWGRRASRQDERWRILASKLFYGLVKRYAMPPGSKVTTGSFLLVDRKVAESYRLFREHNRVTFALIAWTGFEQEVVEYDRQRRVAGTSGWSPTRMIRTMYDTFVGFSEVLVRGITVIGLLVSLVSAIYAVVLLVRWFVGDPAPGWTALMLLLSFFFGLLFLILGILGEYLYRIYAEAVRRPIYIVRDRTE